MSDHLFDGYTLSDIEDLARRAAAITYPFQMPFLERVDIAYGAIAELLCRTHGRLPPIEVLNVGVRAVRNENLAVIHQSGTRNNQTMPRFEMYWRWTCRHRDSPEDLVVERVAFWQIWAKLSERDRTVLRTLVACRTYAKAAAELGISYHAFSTALFRARAKAYELWFWPEPPPRKWGSDRPVTHSQARDYLTTYAIRRRKLKRRKP